MAETDSKIFELNTTRRVEISDKTV